MFTTACLSLFFKLQSVNIWELSDQHPDCSAIKPCCLGPIGSAGCSTKLLSPYCTRRRVICNICTRRAAHFDCYRNKISVQLLSFLSAFGTSDPPLLCCVSLVFLLLGVLGLFFFFACPGPIQLLTGQT